MFKKTLLLFFSLTVIFIVFKNNALFYGGDSYAATNQGSQTASECVIVKVGNPTADPDTSKCNTFLGTASSYALKAIELARSQKGKMYLWAACHGDLSKSPPPGGCANYDCSGLTRWTWYWATDGKVNDLDQTATNWDAGYGNFEKFDKSQVALIQPGDLVYFGPSKADASHTGIYAGLGDCGANDCFIHAPGTGKAVTEYSLSKRTNFIGFLRPIVVE
ncbi:MAG: NlpC/P60 family protein [Candidatus Levyibacteriota bacterium]